MGNLDNDVSRTLSAVAMSALMVAISSSSEPNLMGVDRVTCTRTVGS